MTEFNQGFAECGVTVEHFMPVPEVDDFVYIKRVDIPAGRTLFNHTHTFTHKSVLVSGRVRVTSGDASREISGPAILTIRRGIPHQVDALSDSVWLCLHASLETDPERIDHKLVGEM